MFICGNMHCTTQQYTIHIQLSVRYSQVKLPGVFFFAHPAVSSIYMYNNPLYGLQQCLISCSILHWMSTSFLLLFIFFSFIFSFLEDYQAKLKNIVTMQYIVRQCTTTGWCSIKNFQYDLDCHVSIRVATCLSASIYCCDNG